MIAGHSGVACQECGNANDPLGVMLDTDGRLLCFWCKSPQHPAPPVLEDPWEYAANNGDFLELVCPECAETIRTDLDMIPHEEWGHETRDGGIRLAPLSFPHSYESDYPPACLECGAYLQHSLTPDGEEYVREHYWRHWWPVWGVTA